MALPIAMKYGIPCCSVPVFCVPTSRMAREKSFHKRNLHRLLSCIVIFQCQLGAKPVPGVQIVAHERKILRAEKKNESLLIFH